MQPQKFATTWFNFQNVMHSKRSSEVYKISPCSAFQTGFSHTQHNRLSPTNTRKVRHKQMSMIHKQMRTSLHPSMTGGPRATHTLADMRARAAPTPAHFQPRRPSPQPPPTSRKAEAEIPHAQAFAFAWRPSAETKVAVLPSLPFRRHLSRTFSTRPFDLPPSPRLAFPLPNHPPARPLPPC